MRDVLAIAAPSFGVRSETFIRDHARTVAPGRTILLCHNADGAEGLNCPVLPPRCAPITRRLARGVMLIVRKRGRSGFVWSPRRLSRAENRRAALFLREHGAAAILAEFGPTGVEFAPAAREAGVPLFVHFHGADASALLRFPAALRAYRELFRTAAGVIAPSRFIADKLAGIGCPLDKLHVSPCGIDPERFSSTTRRPFHVLSVGRLVEKKAPHLVIEAFAKVAARFDGARLDLVGAGPLERRCRALVGCRGLEQRVSLDGPVHQDHVIRLMQKASLFAQHSVTAADGDIEGMPVTILEAMASTLPVVATRHSGIAEAVKHGATGLLVAERDVDGMAEAMAALLSDPERAAAMGRAGRARVLEHFTQENTRDRLRAIMGLPPWPAI